ncbi:probable BOI-related E3 ubiquitin-protein ligase 3 isoform X2 [Phragmites australis]|uniref:probable BOI-related E3 ubiquitin-protein ligase 3 isoform X2 n=1 Tax=Phragmites australis TaxID=29695 RepID=UPI002D78059C|nr:probable BOI-related E3 ubiquitin-protein ligase 3 isoform X2 [Phragmites australis]
MAVQAHYHHRESPFLARGGGAPESSRMAAATELSQAQKEAMAPQNPQHLFLDFSHGDCGGGRKRQREAEAAMSPQLFSMQPQAQGPKVISLAQLHKRPATGLRLDFYEGSEHVSSTSSASASCLLSDELAAQRDQHKNEMDRLIQEHAERLRHALALTRRRQYRSLLGAAEPTAARRIREKEAEASEALRCGAELEDRIARLRAEATAWQEKSLADQSTAVALHAQLQQAAAAAAAQARGKAEEDNAAGAADDAESCFVDPDRVVEIVPPPAAAAARTCQTCRQRSASVVLLPCRHLCVCAACEPVVPASAPCAAAVAACPMCRGAVTGTMQVFFS